MQKIVKIIIYVFLVVFSVTCALTLAGLGYLWWGYGGENHQQSLPHLGWLLAISVVEAIGVITIFARRGIKYLPEIKVHKAEGETLKFMGDFIRLGSSVTIVSNRVAWLKSPSSVKDEIIAMTRNGKQLEIITPGPVNEDVRIPLEHAGARFYVTNEAIPPEARFTLVDGHRSGAERLAIARGGHPEHEITIFDNNSGPQIIAMAKDIIRKSKELADAREVE
ncbi:MAG: hypothetical protein ACN6RK_14935 [Stenotrophomonas sp.]